MKTCNKCNRQRNLDYFSKDITKIDGLKTICKNCCSAQKKLKYKQIQRITTINVESKICSKCKEPKKSHLFHLDDRNPDGLCRICKSCRQIENKAKYERNKDKIKKKCNDYYHNNKEKALSCNLRYQNKREKEDILYRLSRRLRNRLYYALQRASWQKGIKFNEYIGCSLEDLKLHLEKQFTEGMSWENYGQWHIDHIKPLSSAKTEEEIYKLCHYSNLQPMWVKENLIKGNRLKGDKND